jgi:hypothetical protein
MTFRKENIEWWYPDSGRGTHEQPIDTSWKKRHQNAPSVGYRSQPNTHYGSVRKLREREENPEQRKRYEQIEQKD